MTVMQLGPEADALAGPSGVSKPPADAGGGGGADPPLLLSSWLEACGAAE